MAGLCIGVQMEEIVDVINENGKLYSERREKLIYFIMAAAVAAIGFVVTQFNNDAINYIYLSKLISIMLFSCSFLFGYSATRQIMNINRITSSLYRKLIEIGNTPDNYKGLTEAATSRFLRIDKDISRREYMQFATMIAGSLFYISGPLIDGYLKGKMTDVITLLG